MKKRTKQFIRTFDIFRHPVSFRYNDQATYQSLTGGCVSIILVISFIGVFLTTLNKTLNKDYIEFDINRYDDENPTHYSSPLNKTFMFAVGLTMIDLNQGDRYFDIYMEFRHYGVNGRHKEYIPLVPCSKEQWAKLGFGHSYDRLGFNAWLCPNSNTSLNLEGKYSSEQFKFYKIGVKQCDPSLDSNRKCVNETQIQQYLDSEEAFTFNFYFVNTILNPGEKQYHRRYLQDVNYFPFSRTSGVNANLFISSYSIQTDQSLLPVQDMKTQYGGIVTDTAQMMNYQVRKDQYMKFYLRKSPISLQIQRSFRGIDDTLSYIGGLFSTILAMLPFLRYYNEFSYQLEIAKNIYYFEKNDPLDADSFNFLTCIGYLIFMFFDKFGIQLQWPKFKRYHRFMEQVRKQMDMRLIMKKILYSERLGLAVIDTHKYKALHMQQPMTLDEANDIRKDHRFYKNFRKKYFPNGQLLEYEAQSCANLATKQETKKQTFFQMLSSDSKVTPIDSNINSPRRQNIEKTQSSAMNMNLNIIMSDAIDNDDISNVKFQNLPPSRPKPRNKRMKLKPTQIKRQQEFIQLDKEMKANVLRLRQEAERGDPISTRIFDKLDQRVKDKYLNDSARSTRNFSNSFKLMLNSNVLNGKYNSIHNANQQEKKKKSKF